MNRSLASLSSLDSDAKDFAVLREVSRFLNVATKTFTASQTHNTDLLVAGHPLSTLNASLSGEEFLKKNARWIASDPSIDESIRPLVASAHAATPGSIEREHAFARLNANKTLLAAYFKIDNLSPIIAAFGSGNSSAARRARVALQWRDKKGRWVEMGRGANFRFRMPDGSVASASGVYVGVRPKRAGENSTAGLIQVSGNKNLPDGIYAVQAGNVETYAARISNEALEKAGITPGATPDQSMVGIPSQADIVATRQDAPTGWTKVDDNPDEPRRIATYTSDDNYTVRVKKFPIGDRPTEYTLYRQNEDGSLGEKVGNAGSWADINDLANGDQEAYDAVKGQDYSSQQQQIKARLDARTVNNAEFDRLEELVKSGVDQNGNTVPDGWEGVVRPGKAADIQRRDIGADIVYAEEGLPFVEYRKKIADDNGNPVFAEAMYYRDGTFAAYDKQYDSWAEADADIPRWIKAEEERRGRKLDAIAALPFDSAPAQEEARASFFDQDGNRIKNSEIFDFSDDENALEFPTIFDPNKPLEEADDFVGVDPARLAKLAEEIAGFEEKWAEINRKNALEKRVKKKKGPFENLKKLEELEGIQMLKVKGADGVEIESPVAEFSDRPMVLVNVNGVRIPFYISTGMGGKKDVPVGEWYPIFGIKDGWFNKGQQDEINDYYGSPELKEVAQWLNNNIGDIRSENIPQIIETDEKEFAEQQLNRDVSPVAYGYNPFLNIRDAVARISGDKERIAEVEEMKANKKDDADDGLEQVRRIEAKIAAQAKDIYDRRMAGDSLDKVAKDLKLTREEVRRIESKYARTLDSGTDKARNIKDVDKALKFLDAHMDDEGLSESAAIGISYVQGQVEDAKRYLENGNTKEAIFSLEIAFDIMDGSDYPSEGRFPTSKNSAEAQDIVDKLITRLEESQSPTTTGEQSQVDIAKNDSDLRPREGSSTGFDYNGGTMVWSSDSSAWMVRDGARDINLGRAATVEEAKRKIDDSRNEISSGTGDGTDEPPTPPTGGGSNTPGSGFSDYVIDLASGNRSPDKDLQERLDEDVEELAVDFIENIYEDAGDEYDLSQDIKDNKPEGMSDKEFIDDAAAQMRENLEAIVDRAIEDRNDFVESGDAEPVDFDKETFINTAIERYKELVQEELDGIREDDGDGDGTDEPPTPPTGGVPPKTPSPNVPSAPGLFNGFSVPDGAFKLNAVDYTPEGRIDETSTDFTDDPQKLATKFTPQDLVQALSQALLGNSSDAALAEILNANVDDDNDIVDPAEIQDSVNIPQVNLGVPSGAGQLEFNAGAEFVPAEALFNAIWEAGLDPNRVVANIYDSVNGNNDNLNKLIDAQGGVPSQEEAQLVDDIVQEIRQLKDASEPGDSPVANEKQTPSPDPLPGALIENIPVDFENPDYYIPNSEAYIPSQPDVDENGYTDNPEILSADYEVADLIEQMLSGITDGSGVALLAFDNVTVEVPVEAMRDAIQYQGINTNQILLDLKKESNDMSEPDSEAPSLQSHSQMIKDLVEQTGNTVDDDTADKIRDAIDEQGLLDWSEADDAEIIEAITEVAGPGLFGQAAPQPEAPVSPAPSAEVAIDSPEVETPQFNYPGPREAGYTPNNVVLDSNDVPVGAGARVQALGDGRAGTILAVQNIDTRSGRDADYVRIRFDDGKVAVRSARQVLGIDGGAPVAEGEGPGQLPPARRNPVIQDPAQRFNEPAASGTPVIAGDGNIPGVQLADTPDDIKQFVNPNAKQADFAIWGLRAPEIARAGRERADINKIVELVELDAAADLIESDSSVSSEERDKARTERAAYKIQIEKLIRDTFGIRPGVKFGKNNYTIGTDARISYNKYRSGELELSIGFRIMNEQGFDIGEGSRTLTTSTVQNPDGTSTTKWTATNNLLKIPNTRDKKSGFVNAYNRYMEDWYIANGFDRVKVYAAGNGAEWQGGIVWALNGFNWQASQASDVPAVLRRMANRPGVTDEEKQIIKRMQDRITRDNPTGNYTPDTVPTPLELALIGWYPGAKDWFGSKYMSKMSWYGQKRLSPDVIEQRQAINYDQSRDARKRIKDKLNQPGVSRELVLKFNSNEFADANPELAPYINYIRDVLRSNRSLAVLSPAAKIALNRYTAGQLLKGEGRDVSLQDIFKLRVALDAEFKADNPFAASKDFGVGDQLLDVPIDDISRNNVPGFTVKRLGMYESGINDTYVVTHNDSGQVFYVKKDSYAAQYQIDGAGAEVQADAMLRASGVVAGYEARVSNVDPEIIVMQRAGAGIPLLGEPMTATNAIGNKLSINLPDGTTIKVDAKNFMDLLHTPEDAVRVMLVDLIISNMDRHNGNLLLAVDGTDTGKIRILPIDHALSSFSPDTEGMEFTVQELFDNRGDNLYGMAMPVLTERLKQEEILDLFRNEARIMMEQLNNPANLPTGKELDLIVKNFGSLDAYRAKIKERIDSLLEPGSEGYKAFLSVLRTDYWN
jgi:hypothetical protein